MRMKVWKRGRVHVSVRLGLWLLVCSAFRYLIITSSIRDCRLDASISAVAGGGAIEGVIAGVGHGTWYGCR